MVTSVKTTLRQLQPPNSQFGLLIVHKCEKYWLTHNDLVHLYNYILRFL